MKKLLLISLFLFSCLSPEEEIEKRNKSEKEWLQKMSNGTLYYKDKRVNLCYAIIPTAYNSAANVPCTPEVEKLIK